MNDFYYGVMITIGSILIGIVIGCSLFIKILDKKIDEMDEEIDTEKMYKLKVNTSKPNIQEATRIIKDEFTKKVTELLHDKGYKDLKFEWNEDGDKK